MDSCEDSDGDGMPNHRDLDLDNNGIFNVVEAGHGAVDTNANGRNDRAPAEFGMNDVIDEVEDAVD